MKRPSNLKPLVLMALLLLAGAPVLAKDSSQDQLFSTVPVGDKVYSQLAELQKTGLLPKEDGSKLLTRFEIAKRIFEAQGKYDEIIVAQADDIPPPPEGETPATTTVAPGPATSAPAAAPAASSSPAVSAPAVPAVKKVDLAQVEKNLHSLSEAYQFELKVVKDQVQELKDRAAAVDADQFEIFKKLKGVIDYPSVSIHGLGRAFLFSRQYYGDYTGVTFGDPGLRASRGYLDLVPTGSIDAHVRWNANLRFSSYFLPNNNTVFVPNDSTDFVFFRQISMNLNPPWLSATVGDFEESYTPLTLWNRNSLDLMYKPEMVARRDDQEKYESFFNHEPNWPFRGLKIGTSVMWPDSSLLERFKISAFANMITNGFNADTKNTTFFGPINFTDWIFAGNVGLKTQKWYAGNMSIQLNVDAQGVVLDEPLYTNAPGSPYNQFDPGTWAHQYLVGSWTPELRMGFGGDFYLGFSSDLAFASYQDDKRDNNKIISDYAMMGGAYLQLENSKLNFNFLNVGPSYYSPLAQVRQDAVFGAAGKATLETSPEIFQSPLRSRYFLTNIPRPGGIFSFYDRTQDNTFPYGMATPNREGFGLDLDVKALEKQALKIKGSAYFVQEISGNLVVNAAQTAVTVLDGTALVPLPVRKFTYVNVGPSLNLGPLVGLSTDLEIGFNGRLEQTESGLGTLTSTWFLGGVKVGLMPSWDVTAAYSVRNSQGTDAGFAGGTWARYSYLYDNSDVGQYTPFTINNEVHSLKLSTAFHVNPNSNFYLDYSLSGGTAEPNLVMTGTLNNQFMELTYEIQF